jgi:RimJ/RimL family protein N-acetyltransferase
MFIRSERLFLRPAWPEDWEELYALIADEGIARNLANVPWPYCHEHAREFTARAQDLRLPSLLVTLPGADGSRIVGCCGLGEYEGHVELGYWIGREYWGRGYATEAARAVLRLARAIGYRRIRAGHFADNPASGKVLRKAGFKATGRRRQRFSLGRGCEAVSIEYVAELHGACSREDGGGTGAFDRLAA